MTGTDFLLAALLIFLGGAIYGVIWPELWRPIVAWMDDKPVTRPPATTAAAGLVGAVCILLGLGVIW